MQDRHPAPPATSSVHDWVPISARELSLTVCVVPGTIPLVVCPRSVAPEGFKRIGCRAGRDCIGIVELICTNSISTVFNPPASQPSGLQTLQTLNGPGPQTPRPSNAPALKRPGPQTSRPPSAQVPRPLNAPALKLPIRWQLTIAAAETGNEGLAA
jgi:hypothetical protein